MREGGVSGYTVKEGYSKMLMESQHPLHSRVWKTYGREIHFPKLISFVG
jgi:hypothetical protein